jgi:excisionase family DNA binding protein
MSLFNEAELRDIIRDELRAVIRQELGKKPAAAGDYVSVTDAAKIASVQGQTIRSWIRSGRLAGYKAGRVARVRRSDLEAFLAAGPAANGGTDLSPEQLADQRFRERHDRRRQRANARTTAALPRTFERGQAKPNTAEAPATPLADEA